MRAKAKNTAKLCLLTLLFLLPASLNALTINDVWINEIHYDNVGGDQGEFIELAAKPGADLSSLLLTRYDGSVFTPESPTYFASDATIDTISNGLRILVFDQFSSLENGIEGIAITGSDDFFQFLSYEGAFQASGGSVDGKTSIDIGVAEDSSTPVGFSLQFQGIEGNGIWLSASTNSKGAANPGQSYSDVNSNSGSDSHSVPDNGPTLTLASFGLAALITLKRRRG